MAGLAELRVAGLGWSLQGKWVCPGGSCLQVWGKCARPSVETSFSSTVCTGCWALDTIATSSSVDHVTTYRRGTSLFHPPKLLVVSRTLVIVQATFFVLRGLRVCQDPLQCESSLACPICSSGSAHFWVSFNGLCCSCRGGGELRSLLCLSPGPELPVCSSFTYTSGEGKGTPLQYSCLENPMNGGAW